MPKVLVADKLSNEAVAIFQKNGIETVVKTGMTTDEFVKEIADVDGLVVRSAAKPNAEIIKAGKNLKVIGRAGIGVDNIDIAAASAQKVIVMNTPFGNTITTAEHAVAMMMSLARNIPQANAEMTDGAWPKAKYQGVELCGKTLGVVGCGNIGSIVADRGLGLKMKVIAFDPFLTEEKATTWGITKVELDELLKSADFITLHTPSTPETKGMINKDSIAKMKKGVYIINCARGNLVVAEDLVAAIDNGQVSGAAIDVFDGEPPAEDHVFRKHPKVICTPHLGASTKEAEEKVSLQVAEQISEYLLTGKAVNVINKDVLK
ncbi:MAG: hydroxyacid dehydrogenase [Alphaproteobacteria bacterium]